MVKTLTVLKQRKVSEDAEPLAAAVKVVGDMPEMQDHHVELLTAQLAGILEAGLADGTLPGVGDSHSTSTAILNATTRFHHPVMVANGGAPFRPDARFGWRDISHHVGAEEHKRLLLV